jgi:oligopeptide transport system ATP-binding protein
VSERPPDRVPSANGSSAMEMEIDRALPLVEARDLVKHFPVTAGSFFARKRGAVHAVDGVSLAIPRGQTLGVVGESGCGKSTLGRLLLRLIESSAGEIRFAGQDITQIGAGEMRRLRREMQIVFQDPYGSLNPRCTAGEIVARPLVIHGMASRAQAEQRAAELLELVGLEAEMSRRYPHEFSGGQRQRIGIARALALRPSFIVLDEPTSSLDVSVQAQILNLLNDLRRDLGLTYLFISHNLNVVKYFCDSTVVMYLGQIVEEGPSEAIHEAPLHPYTQALVSAVLAPEVGKQRERLVLEGDVPSPVNPPGGCRFHTRCPYAMAICRQAQPVFTEQAPGHRVACHLYSANGNVTQRDVAMEKGGGMAGSAPSHPA